MFSHTDLGIYWLYVSLYENLVLVSLFVMAILLW